MKNISDRINEHVFLACKRAGDCKSLTGNVLITVILVDDSESCWTYADIEEFKRAQTIATLKLNADARDYGVELSVSINYLRCQVKGTFNNSDHSEWISNALKAANLPEKDNVIPTLKRIYAVKEAPVIFAVNRKGRSFTMQSDYPEFFEYTILYQGHGDYRHELYHLFGAKDFYFPDAIKAVGQKYFPDSIMMTSGNVITDSLTAYLIGWTDTLSEDALKFLDETSWVTREYIIEVARQETFGGHGSIRYGDGTYTGELFGGVPHGKGKIIWDDGNTYEGDWVYGSAEGWGTIVWNVNGTSYTGNWKKWQLHGYGSYTYADGTKLTGQWENNNFKE